MTSFASSEPFGRTRFPLAPLGGVAEITLGKMIQTQEQVDQRRVPYIKASNVRPHAVDVDSLDEMWATDNDIVRLNVRRGDLFIIEGGATAGRVASLPADAPPSTIFQNSVHRIRARHPADQRFLQYALGCLPSTGWYDAICGVATFKHLTSEKLARVRIPMPPLEEQWAIVRFMDERTAKIDALIKKKTELMELLEVRRRNLIGSAVTGERTSGPKKPVEIYWLKGIPQHWQLRRLKTIARLESGHTPSRSDPSLWIDCTIPWVSLNDVGVMRDVRYLKATTNMISEQGLARSSARLLPARTVVLSRDATVGRTAILARPMATSQHFVDWICDESVLLPEYLYYIFKEPMQREFNRLTMGSTLRTIGLPDVNSFAVPVPPIQEQEAIVSFCERVEEAGRKHQFLVKRGIELLNEYRSALITAAVTGQIDVRSAA